MKPDLNKPTATVCAIIPAYNEGERILPVIRGALEHCSCVIVVDDGSSDATATVAREAGAIVVVNEQNLGKGASLMRGLDRAIKEGYDLLVTLDADGQHDPDEIPEFLNEYQSTGQAALVGNRMADIKDMPRIRIWTNQFMSWLLGRVMGQYVPDTQCGYRLYHRDVVQYLSTSAQRFAAESENLLRLADAGVQIGAVPIKTIYGDEKSKINPVVDTFRFFDMLRNHKKNRKSNHARSS